MRRDETRLALASFRRFGALLPAISFLLVAASCLDREVACLEPLVESGVAVEIQQDSAVIDLVFLIDDSGSMAEEQANLALQIPRLIRALICGRTDPMCARFDAMGNELYPPVQDLHVGIVSSALGPLTSTCTDDRGLFIDTYRPPASSPQYDATCSGTTYPRYLAWTAAGDAAYPSAQMIHDVGCLATLGTLGCGFEQHLEATYQALTTHLSGDGLNNSPTTGDFLRPNSLLVVITLADEDDCSASDNSVFDPPQTNLSCFNNPTLLHDTARYRNGFALDVIPRHAINRIVLADIVGIPLDLSGRNPADILRDPRMTPTPNSGGTNLLPVCDAGTNGLAYPARRLLEVLGPYYDADNAVAHSICSSDFSPAIDKVTRLITAHLTGRCLQRTAQADPATCESTCSVILTLASSSCAVGALCANDCMPYGGGCDPAISPCGVVIADAQLGGAARTQCVVPAVWDVPANTPPAGGWCDCWNHPITTISPCATSGYNGWFYDRDDLVDCPAAGQWYGKVVFWGSAIPPDGATVRMECLSRVDAPPSTLTCGDGGM